MSLNKSAVISEQQIEEMNSIKWWHKIPLGIDAEGKPIVTPGICNHGNMDSDYVTSRFGLPQDLSGKSVLDIGGWDGLFSFEAEKRGAASVLVADLPEPQDHRKGFDWAKKVLKSKVDYKEMSVYELGSLANQYDVVLFYGVLYHVLEPYTALKLACDKVKEGGLILLESAITQRRELKDIPSMEFLPGFDNDPTNYYYPSEAALHTMLKHIGMQYIETIFNMDGIRLTIKATKPHASA